MGSLFSAKKPAISLKRGKTGRRLLLITSRKSHTRFRLVPKSTTLDDLEGPLFILFNPFVNNNNNNKNIRFRPSWDGRFHFSEGCESSFLFQRASVSIQRYNAIILLHQSFTEENRPEFRVLIFPLIFYFLRELLPEVFHDLDSY